MNAITQTVDKPSGLCQQDAISETVSLLGETGVVGTQSETDRTVNRRGRPRITTELPWDIQGISRSTYYERLKPIMPTQISYAPEELRWYCVRTEYGAETAVDVALRTAGFQTFYPLLWVPPVAARRTELGRAIPATSERLVPLLLRYILVRFDRSNPSWRYIPTMPGVERVFSTHPERPIPVPDGDIERLRAWLGPNGVLYPPAQHATVTYAKRRWMNMVEALKARQDAA